MELLRYVLLTNGLLAVVSIAFYTLLRRETFFNANRWALWLGVAGALLLPLLRLPDWRPQPIRKVMQRTAQVIVPRVLPQPVGAQPEITITYPNQQTYRAFRNAAKPVNWSWQYALIALYLAGAGVLLLRFCIQLLSLRRLIRRSAHEPYDDFTLVNSTDVGSPFSFFHWVFINPRQHDPAELEQILRHERVHVRERHSLDTLGAELICLLFWLNPAAYLFRYLLHQTLEFSADRAVLAEGVDAQAYQYSLVKVSMLANQPMPTNHFSKSQLNSRIRMINQPGSSAVVWLRYPVLLLAVLTIASAFVQPQQVRQLSVFVPQPITEVLAGVTIPVAESSTIPDSIETVNPAPDSVVVPRHTQSAEPKAPAETGADSTIQETSRDTVRTSSSRYIQYEGTRLYWIVTPKTTLEDFVGMKQEFARYNYALQLKELKLDPLGAYINGISISVNKANGGGAATSMVNDDYKPITSIAGYFDIRQNAGERGISQSMHFTKELFLESLRKTAEADEADVARFIEAHKLEYLINDGNQKFKEYGNGSTTYGNNFFQGPFPQHTGLSTDTAGNLSVSDGFGDAQVFINNEPATPEMLHVLKARQIHTLVRRTKTDPATKKSTTTALLIYVEK